MNKFIVYSYKTKFLILWGFIILFEWFYFITSNCTLDNWLISTKYIGIYLNTIYFLIVVDRTKLFKSIRDLTILRIGKSKYFEFLVKAALIDVLLYISSVYLPLLILSKFTIQSIIVLTIYFIIVIVQMVIIQQINLFVIFFKKSSMCLGLILFINIFFQFFIISNIFWTN